VRAYRFSRRADADLIDIAEYGEPRWGETRAIAYLDALLEAAQRVADMPGIGRACDHIRPGYFRIEEGRHVLFFKRDERGILIVRVLHDTMDPLRHIDDDEE
jgi:toxin ParE1/3/4